MATPAADIDLMEEDNLLRPADIEAADGELLEIDLDDLADGGNNTVLPILIEVQAKSKSWMMIAQEHMRCGRVGMAEQTLLAGAQIFGNRNDLNGLVEAYTFLGHISLGQTKTSPHTILKNARHDILPDQLAKLKSDHLTQALKHFQTAEQIAARADEGKVGRGVLRLPLTIGKIMHNLATFAFAEAEKNILAAIAIQPNNLVVLMCQGRLGNAQRNPAVSLKAYQKVLSLAPDFSPDPRVGLGLAFFQSGDVRKARVAWRRALDRDPQNHGAQLLLSTLSLNESKDLSNPLSLQRRKELYAEALKAMNELFTKSGQKSAPAALAMIRNLEVAGLGGKAIKLAERAIQYADTNVHYRRALSERTRLAYVTGEMGDAAAFAAQSERAPDVVVEIVRAQMAIKSGDYRGALNVMETLTGRIKDPKPLEVNIMYALLLAFPHIGMSPADQLANLKTARDILDKIHEEVKAARAAGPDAIAKMRGVAEDPEPFVLLATLWQKDNLDKAVGAYQTAIAIHTIGQAAVKLAEAENGVGEGQGLGKDMKGLKMSNNLATLYHLQGNVDGATQMYEQVVGGIGDDQSGEDEDALLSTVLYNLARAYEDGDEYPKAAEAFKALLRRHPEFTAAKIRLAQMAYVSGRQVEADALLKEATVSSATDPVLRAYISTHLMRQGPTQYAELMRYAQVSRKYIPEDPHTWCILGAMHYHNGREMGSKASHVERLKEFCKSAEAYSQALVADPTCAVAAQGLAISIAEDSLSAKPSESLGGEEASKALRIKNADTALSILGRVKDSISDGSVLVNCGHCYYAKGEEERAIESYASASTFYKHQDISTLLYLARASYQLANKKSNFSIMMKALKYCQKAFRLRPTDKSILYNLAMIGQKAAELLFSLAPADRTPKELNTAIEQARHSTVLFRTLAENRDRPLPYDHDLADQRSKYGESLSRKAADQRQKQEAYENSVEAKDQLAKQKRAEERARIEELERVKIAEAQERAIQESAILAAQKTQAQAWARQMREAQELEEMRKLDGRGKRQKREEEVYSGEEEGRERDVKPKRKRKEKGEGRKKKQSRAEGSEGEMDVDVDMENGEEEEAKGTDDEAGGGVESRSRSRTPKPKKKRPAVVDPDGDDGDMVTRPVKKTKIKSVAVLGDTDSE